MKHRFGITSKRERWRGIRTIPETVDGYDWAPVEFITRSYYWRGHRIWQRQLAIRYHEAERAMLEDALNGFITNGELH